MLVAAPAIRNGSNRRYDEGLFRHDARMGSAAGGRGTACSSSAGGPARDVRHGFHDNPVAHRNGPPWADSVDKWREMEQSGAPWEIGTG